MAEFGAWTSGAVPKPCAAPLGLGFLLDGNTQGGVPRERDLPWATDIPPRWGFGDPSPWLLPTPGPRRVRGCVGGPGVADRLRQAT
jgi:hypothetical protein